jgi:hypothetical protein
MRNPPPRPVCFLPPAHYVKPGASSNADHKTTRGSFKPRGSDGKFKAQRAALAPAHVPATLPRYSILMLITKKAPTLMELCRQRGLSDKGDKPTLMETLCKFFSSQTDCALEKQALEYYRGSLPTLRRCCLQFGIDTKGNKDELVLRLLGHNGHLPAVVYAQCGVRDGSADVRLEADKSFEMDFMPGVSLWEEVWVNGLPMWREPVADSGVCVGPASQQPSASLSPVAEITASQIVNSHLETNQISQVGPELIGAIPPMQPGPSAEWSNTMVYDDEATESESESELLSDAAHALEMFANGAREVPTTRKRARGDTEQMDVATSAKNKAARVDESHAPSSQFQAAHATEIYALDLPHCKEKLLSLARGRVTNFSRLEKQELVCRLSPHDPCKREIAKLLDSTITELHQGLQERGHPSTSKSKQELVRRLHQLDCTNGCLARAPRQPQPIVRPRKKCKQANCTGVVRELEPSDFPRQEQSIVATSITRVNQPKGALSF